MIVRLQRGADSDPLENDEHLGGDDDLIDQAVHIFSAKYGRPIGREEAREMTRRLTAFFSVLIDWRLDCSEVAERRAA